MKRLKDFKKKQKIRKMKIITFLLVKALLAENIFEKFSFPNVRIVPFKQNDKDIEKYFERIKKLHLNHSPAEIADNAKKFKVNQKRVKIGSGKKCYQEAVKLIRNGSIVDKTVPWAQLLMEKGSKNKRIAKNDLLLTQALCYKVIWAVSPCKVVSAENNATFTRNSDSKGICSSISISTLKGHLISGEERFSVEMCFEDGSVWLDLYSVSRGAGVLGTIAMPLIRPLQKAFFKEICKNVSQVVLSDQN
mmetsp:Transcript_2253/g.3210  ORF Transcript_2253/g.3210 Transcript_2253/m.3210 type:complete len:248 (-) Transcript_2253:41-784(-)